MAPSEFEQQPLLTRKVEIRRGVRWYSIIVTTALLIAVVYLAYFGVIGIRTWS